jgi:hypothetical protein
MVERPLLSSESANSSNNLYLSFATANFDPSKRANGGMSRIFSPGTSGPKAKFGSGA